MAYVARWSIEVQFGRKPDLFATAKKFEEWAVTRGWPKARVLVNAIGGSEARVAFEYELESLAQLENLWSKLPHDEAFRDWQQQMAQLVVPGSPHWEVWRVAE